MYNEPLSFYREYIQNAVDSMDLLRVSNKRSALRVNIDLNPIKHSIRVFDNGLGVPAGIAERILSTIGSSEKTGRSLRGFRGIGRLGGIAFSEKAIYRTKAKGEKVESIQEWNCGELRRMLIDPRYSSMTLNRVFNRITTFYQRNCKRASGSYFEVTLEGVSSFRNYNLDIERVGNYLSQVAPVAFHPDEFSHGRKIDDYLSSKLSHYGRYDIILNGRPVYKPYRDRVRITKGSPDYIDNIKVFDIKVKDESVGYGWYGERRNLYGAIAKGESCSGIRIRIGNILLGDCHLLDGCFREPRFNSYVIGEIHVECPKLVPNSRRDDFVDNEMKTLFYNALEREIGLPISKEIRLRSRLKSKAMEDPSEGENRESEPPLECAQKESGAHDIRQWRDISESTLANKILGELVGTCEGCSKLSSVLSKIDGLVKSHSAILSSNP
jgi:molecular chaperone HtpG